MLSILLTVLKIIGLILLWILIIVFALLLIILLVPIRYRIDGVIEPEGNKDAKLKVTWLLHAVSFSLMYKDKKMSTLIRLFGIPLGKKGDSEETEDQEPPKKQPQKKKKKKKPKNKKPEEKPVSKDEAKQEETTEKNYDIKNEKDKEKTVSENVGKETEIKEKTEEINTADKKAEPEDAVREEKNLYGEEAGRSQIESKVVSLIEKILLKLSPVLHKIKYKLSDIIHMFDPEAPLMLKLDFITNLRTKHAIFLALAYVFRVLGHILPHKAHGYIRFGFDNPATTGQVLAITSATSAIHKNVLELRPDFENKVIDIDAGLKGRIYLGYIVWGAIVLILRKDVLYVIKNYKKYF